jgi:GNAT superfamily N-acetyltransferase
MVDPKVVAVEENLFEWRRIFREVDGVANCSAPDVQACCSPVPSHLFNGVCEARFDDWGSRAKEVADTFVARGLPWFWWVTPTTTSPELERVLQGHGMSRMDVPGMYLDLGQWVPAPVPAGVELVAGSPEQEESVDTLLRAFGLPAASRGPLMAHAAAFARANTFSVFARLNGEPVAGGLGLVTGDTVGLYMIATQEELRGRGIGRAVTEALLAEGKARGTKHAILHTSPMGRPVYERIGFAEVCDTAQYVWMPRA